MKLRGKSETKDVDIMMYHGIYDLASDKIKKVDEELIPTFIIEEALNYFCELEKYECCQKIKSFFQINPTYTIQSTRDAWYGMIDIKTQKH